MYLYWITKGDINYGSLPCHAIVDYRINMQIYLRIEILQMLTFASSPFYIYNQSHFVWVLRWAIIISAINNRHISFWHSKKVIKNMYKKLMYFKLK